MRLIVTGDWHLTDKTPRNRKDDYQKTQQDKIAWIFEFAANEGIVNILQPGDMFNSPNASTKFRSEWMSFFGSYDPAWIITVPGQHDLVNRSSDIFKANIGLFYSADRISVLGQRTQLLGNDTYIQGAGWAEDIPDLISPELFKNILLTHRMVALEGEWPGHEDYDVPGPLLRKYKYDLIVSGDNHRSFHYKDKDRWLINCGSLMRSRADQIDHKPCIWVYDTETKEATQHFIPIKPSEEVIHIERVRKEKEKNEKLQELITAMSKGIDLTGFDFKQTLYQISDSLKKEKLLPKATENMIEEIMSDA